MNTSSKTPSHAIPASSPIYNPPLLKTLNRLFSIACLFSLPQLGWALPYIDSLYTLQDNWNTITYARIVWPPETSSEVICHTILDCSVRACIASRSPGKSCKADMDDTHVNIVNGDTLKEAREAWVRQYGVISREFRFKHTIQIDECITVGGGVVGSVPFSGVTCVPTKQPNVICTVSDKLDFVYNTLNSDQVHNAEAYGTLAVKCNSTATVNLRLVGPSEIDLGRGGTLRARLHIGGYSLTNGYSLKAGPTTTSLKVTSVLQSSLQEAQTGTFKGEGIIIMNMQ